MSAAPETTLQIDIGRAFSAPFEDAEWVKKILVGGLISIIPILGIWIIYGYMIEIARRVYNDPQTPGLPEWDDIGGYLARGFFFWAGLFLWALPFILLIVCAVLAMISLGLAIGGGVAIGVSLMLLCCLFFPLMMLYSVAAVIGVPVLLGRYAVHGRFAALFEFGEIIAEVRRIGVVPLALLSAICYVAAYIGQLGVAFCFVGVFFTGFYGSVVIGHASGQSARLARGIRPMPGAFTQPAGA